MADLRIGAYRWLTKAVAPWVERSILKRAPGGGDWWSVSRPEATELIWFHAASAGELEILWELVVAAAARGTAVVVTGFSRSAEKSLARLQTELRARAELRASERGAILWVGGSPLEGCWAEALDHLRPSVFVTAKYEAWPELWASLGERNIPLVVVSARARRSLRAAKSACRLMGARLPRIRFVVSDERHRGELERDFPGSSIEVLGDPRWDRVQARALKRNGRAEELIAAAASAAWPRPWGVLGSAWPEDLALWEKGAAGTIWVVPHTSDRELLKQMERRIASWDPGYVRTSESDSLEAIRMRQSAAQSSVDRAMDRRIIWVDEHGFLSELYGAADWAYVGGGLRAAGLHSVIEPALQGIPVSGGTSKTDTMSEIESLSRSGQFTRIGSIEDLEGWIRGMDSVKASDRLRWKSEAQSRLGAAQRILELI